MNPCPCGYHNHPDKECNCPPGAVLKYLNRISGPLLDRIDLHMEVSPVPYSQLSAPGEEEPSLQIRERVVAARMIQLERYSGHPGIHCNAQMNSKLLKEICPIDAAGESLLRIAMNKLHLSARAHERILKVSRTIADLALSEAIRPEHLAEAIQYRSLDRERWVR
jgi:magnesium chelatase family protein